MKNEALLEGMKKANKILEQSNDLEIQLYLEHMLFSWRWWVLAISFVLSWIMWIRFHKKESRDRLLHAGMVSTILALFFDSTGHQIGLWSYTYELLPQAPLNVAWDLAFLPVSVMGLIQVNPHIKPLYKALFLAGTMAFIFEPVFKNLHFFEYPKWEYYYSFLVYIFIYLVANFIASRNKFERI